MSDYTARDIHLLDQAYPDALADIEDYIGNPVHKRRLAEVGPEVFAAELTFDLSASFDKPTTLAGWAAVATVRLMECGKAWEEDTEMAYDQRDAARAMADELRAELDKVRAQLADTQKRAHTDATNLQQILRDKTALANERDAMREQLFAQKPVIEAAEAWAELRDEEGITLADTRKADAALFDAIESYRLMDMALTSARDEAEVAR